MMCPRNWGPASFQLRRAPSARSAKRPLRVPIQSMLDMKEGSSPRCRVVNGAHRPGGESLSRCAPSIPPASLRGASPRSVCFAACRLARTRAGVGFTVHRYRSRMQAALLPGVLTLIAFSAASALARPPAAQPLPVRHAGDGAFAALVHQHEVRRHQLRSLDSYTDEPVRGVDWQIQGMSATGPATRGTDREWRAAIARVRAVPAYLASARRQLAAGVAAHRTPDWRMLSAFGLESTAADAEYFGSTLGQIAAANIGTVHRAALLHELQAAGNQAAEAYRRLRDFVADTFFENPRASGVAALKSEYRADRFALGESEYDWALRNNLHLTGTAAKLFEASWPVVEETRNEMITLAQQIAAAHKWPAAGAGPETVRAVFAQLTQNAPRTDAEMMEGYRRTGERLVEYARRTGLFDVPADYRLEVTVTPPPLRASIEGGAYYPAPPFKKSGVGRFYVSPTGDDATELREEHNYAAMPDLAAHEGFPGHDWHYKLMTQYRAQISPLRWLTPGAVEDSSSMWEDSMAAEGWALYSEALLAEPQPGAPEGFYTPEERLYQLRGRLYRDLRVQIGRAHV